MYIIREIRNKRNEIRRIAHQPLLCLKVGFMEGLEMSGEASLWHRKTLERFQLEIA